MNSVIHLLKKKKRYVKASWPCTVLSLHCPPCMVFLLFVPHVCNKANNLCRLFYLPLQTLQSVIVRKHVPPTLSHITFIFITHSISMISEISGTTRDNSVTYGLIIDLHPIESSAVLLLDGEWVKKCFFFCVCFLTYTHSCSSYILPAKWTEPVFSAH